MQPKPEHRHQVIENVNDAVYTTDLLGNFTSVNPAGERLTGYSSEEMMKVNVAPVIVPKYMDLVRQKMQQKFTQDIATVYEIEILTKDGHHIPVEISSRALHENGKATGILGIARDITERKILEQQKEIFFSLITHEIKNPLSSIKAFAELLKKYHAKSKDEKPKHYSAMINAQADRLTVLVNDFLDISRMNAGKFIISKEKFDLYSLVTEIVETFNDSLSEKRIRIAHDGKQFITADRGRIGQVLTNLLSNALKYSPPDSEVTVHVTKEKKQLIVRITDKGQGIPNENQKTIFELFYRLEHHQQDQIKGHGLGLYICKQIIKEHKGEIGVESTDKNGTTFYFSLPYLPAGKPLLTKGIERL